MKLKEEKKEMDKKFNDEIETIEKEKQKEQKDFQDKKNEIEIFLNSFPDKNAEYDSLLNSLKKFYTKRLSQYKSLQKSSQDKKSSSSSITLPLPELKERINNCDQSLLHEIFNTIEIIRNIHPYLLTPSQLNMENIIDVMESLITQISNILNDETPQEKMNSERVVQIEEIGPKLADIYRTKFIKNVFYNALKMNCVEEKKKKDAEKKMKELKDKEEKLKQLQLKYINEKSNKDSQMSEKSDNNSFLSINDDLDFILKEKETPKKPIEKQRTVSPNMSSSSDINSVNDKSAISSNSTINTSNANNSNIINISIKDIKKKEEKKKKNSNINVILEEEDISKSKSESKSKSKSRTKEKKERRDSSEQERRNNKQKSIKKKMKPSQMKKKNKKKKKFESDSSDENVSNKEEDSFMNQILGITSEFMDKSGENKQMKNCETDRKRAKGDMKFGKNKFNCYEESNKKSTASNDFDLNDLDFLTSLGEEVNKSEKSYGFGRKYNFKK
jgi:hypothetical protein